MNPYRKLVVLGTNHLIEHGLIKLDADADEVGHVQTELAGKNCLIQWRGAGFGEIKITVWWDFVPANYPRAAAAAEDYTADRPVTDRKDYGKFIGAMAGCWLERREGKYLQGKGSDFLSFKYARRGEAEKLKAIPTPVPLGYSAEGRTHF